MVNLYVLAQTILATGGDTLPRGRTVMPQSYIPQGPAFDDRATRYLLGQSVLTGASVPASYYRSTMILGVCQ